MKWLCLVALFMIHVCFSQTDEKNISNQVFLELSGGFNKIVFDEKTLSKDGYYWRKDQFLYYPAANLGLYYRSKSINAGFQTNLLLVFDLKAKLTINLFPKSPNIFIGPYVSPSIYVLKRFSGEYLYSANAGMDFFLKNWHLDLGYTYYGNRKDYGGRRHSIGPTISFGYQFNLGKKKK